MKRNILVRANLFVCVVIILGFITTSVISYKSNKGIFKKDVESVSALTSEGIYHNIDSLFTRPVNVSLTMANDSLLKEFLAEEQGQLADNAFIESMRDYLHGYHEKYGYDSVFLVSAETGRYYHYNGLDRTLKPGSKDDEWFYSLLDAPEEYILNIDDDEAAANEITIFVNCKIKGADGSTMGVVGVGFRVDSLQELLGQYEKKFGVRATLIDREGSIAVSTAATGYHAENLFASSAYPDLRDQILACPEGQQTFWYSSQRGSGYLVSQYIENLDWTLLIDNDTSGLDARLAWQLAGGIAVVIFVMALVLLIITDIMRRYNKTIVELTVAKEQAHHSVFQQVTEKMYENIYELDITHQRAASEATEEYFQSMGVPPKTPYDEALKIIARRQIKPEFRQGYIDTFCSENVLRAYQEGVESLHYDFMVANDSGEYYWIRITGRIFYWDDDQSVRMFTYRQNIDLEKQQEGRLLEQMERDSLSGLYNKAATQRNIQKLLARRPEGRFAFFILDIDDFKQVNDRAGHAAGDRVIAEFAKRLRAQFDDGEIVGRIGGDEFVAFVAAQDDGWIAEKARSLVEALRFELTDSAIQIRITASVGAAAAPAAGMEFDTLYRNADFALYRSKKNGKDGFTVFRKEI